MKTKATFVGVIVACVVAVVVAQTVKTDRDLLTEALALLAQVKDTSSEWTPAQRTAFRNGESRIQTARDQRPQNPQPPTTLTCAPSTQTVQTSSPATMRATGGTGTYAWTASGGTPASGNSSAFSTSYGTAGTKSVGVASGTQSASCQVEVTASQPPPPPPPPPTPGFLFASSWETALGCNGPALLDNGAWQDYGGSGACSGMVHDADVVRDVARDGAQSLRITQKPGNTNGTDYRSIRTFGSQKDVTLVSWLYFDSNYHWASADQKIFLFMDPTGNAPNLYVNYRGGSDSKHARICVYPTAQDTFFCAPNPQVTTGVWYRLRVHVVAGSRGTAEVWLMPDGQAETKLNLVFDAGNSSVNMDALNVGTIGGLKLDTTYNCGSCITKDPIFQYYDGLAVYSGLAQ